jgi:outer membrane protein assembly factor BamA
VDISKRILRRHIPVYQEHAVDQDLLVEGARNLRDYFQGKGFFEAEVEFKTQKVINDKATIDFLINAGERHRLSYIDIAGNRYFRTSVGKILSHSATKVEFHECNDWKNENGIYRTLDLIGGPGA